MHKTYRSSAVTQQTVLQRAVELFNEQGTGAISMNHIAEAASISPGNLYYHFKNKEEIIRTILDQMILDWNVLYQSPSPETFDIDALRQFLKQSFTLVWKYRFFYRELVVLLRKDDLLRQRYEAIQQQRLADQNAFLQQMIKLNGMNKDTAELSNALRIAWILSENWILHLEITGQPVNEQTTQEGVELVLHILTPYLDTAK